MPSDPAFNFNALNDPTTGFAYFDLLGGSGYLAVEDGGSGEVLPAGSTLPVAYEEQPMIACAWPGSDINAWYDPDGMGVRWVHSGASWNTETDGLPPMVAPVGAAADTLLAAYPEIDYFTIEPFASIGLGLYATGCPAAFSFDGAPDPGINPPADLPPPSVRVSPQMQNRAQEYFAGASTADADLLDVAANIYGSWWIADHWGPDVTGDDVATSYPTYGSIGKIAGVEAYILRPTTLSWAGQDTSNTADRVFWERADIPDVITHQAHWYGGHPSVQASIAVRGWKLIPLAVATDAPVICFV